MTTTTTTITGTIKTLNERKYGFITDQSGEDVFFHQSDLVGVDFGSLVIGDALTFTVSQTAKGPRATNITRPTSA